MPEVPKTKWDNIVPKATKLIVHTRGNEDIHIKHPKTMATLSYLHVNVVDLGKDVRAVC